MITLEIIAGDLTSSSQKNQAVQWGCNKGQGDTHQRVWRTSKLATQERLDLSMPNLQLRSEMAGITNENYHRFVLIGKK